MKVQQKIDKVLEIVRERIQEEVGALMGVEFQLSDTFGQLSSKEEYIAEQSGKKIVARMDVTGEIEGLGALFIGIKDAIRLGGTLIMLPQTELDEVVNSESYTEETEDSYGEIANIIAGSYTKVFEEMYPQNCRFVRKEQEVVVPLKVDIESDEPFPDQWYYVVKNGMSIDGVTMGDLDMLIPAEAFGFEMPEESESTSPAEESVIQETAPEPAEASVQEEVSIPEIAEEQTGATAEPAAVEQVEGDEAKPSVDIEKHKKLVDKLLTACNDTLAMEVGALLGVDVQLSNYSCKPISKEDFFLEEASGKQVLTHMDVVDGLEGQGYLFIGIKDAIRIGSILIMLPPSELESAVNEAEMSPDAEDAYGEIANIIAGSYTSIFQDQYTESIRFIKTELETVVPMKVDTDSDDVVPNQQYYMNTAELNIDGQDCGNLCMLIPIDLLQLDQLLRTVQDEPHIEETQVKEKVSTISADPTSQAAKDVSDSTAGEMVSDAYEILIIENANSAAENIREELGQMGLTSKTISFNDNIDFYLTSQLRLVVIVMQSVDEQAFGVTIKVNSHSTAPIVAAGNQWTRTKVIKAVKYGVTDILLTPATKEDVQDKIQNNMLQLAA